MMCRCGLIDWYISVDGVVLIHQAVTSQPAQPINSERWHEYDEVGGSILHSTPHKRISETTKRQRYKQRVKEEYNNDKGLLLRR